MSPDRVPVRDDLADLEPYGAPQLDVSVRLNTNETAEPPPEGYLERVAERIQSLELNRYPDRAHRLLRETLAARFDRDPAGVWAANGSNEVLAQLFQAYGGPRRRVATVVPGYSMYPVIAQVTMTPVTYVDLDDSFGWSGNTAEQLASVNASLIVVANPNNPTGVPVPIEVIRQLHDQSRALVVVDEAYVEFGGESAVDLLDELPRLAVVRTFSKAFRLAGLRLGYLVTHPWVVDDIRRVRLPYHLDAIKQVAALVALEHEDDFLRHRQVTAEERERVREGLERIPGIRVWPSVGNFLLFQTDESGLFDRLLERDVLIRDFSDKPRLAGCLRVTIGTPSENDAFLSAITAELTAD